MEQNTEKQLPARFIRDLADIPPLPGHLYGELTRKIDRRILFTRSLWAAAAMFIIALSSFTAFRNAAPRVSYSPEIVDEIVSISSFYNNGGIDDDDESNYETVLYIP